MSDQTVALDGPLTEKKNRIGYLDLAKGIGIILVVWAHARGPLQSYIYQFHMPFFFILSGLLYSEKSSFKEYLWKKTKGLYIPFVFWNLLFYVTKTIIRGSSALTILKNAGLIVLTLSKDGEFMGATWFLGSLFLVSIFYKILDLVIKESKFKPLLILFIFASLTAIGFAKTFPYLTSRTLILGLFFAIGALVKKYKEYFKDVVGGITAVICLLMYIVIASFNSANMGKNEYSNPLLFVIGSILASYALIVFCKLFEEKVKVLQPVKRFIMFLGRRSLDILIWQFVAFRIVILLQMVIYKEELTIGNLLSYYPVYDSSNFWWIAYFVVGLFIPIGFCSLLRLGFWGKAFKKIHIV